MNDHNKKGCDPPPPSSLIDPSKVAHLTEVERGQLFEVLDRYPSDFSNKPGFCPFVAHEIKISDDFKARRLRAYKVPELLRPKVDRQISEMLDLGIIVLSNSKMASFVVCVLKGPNGKNGVRLAIDYRHVNQYFPVIVFRLPTYPMFCRRLERPITYFVSTLDVVIGSCR